MKRFLPKLGFLCLPLVVLVIAELTLPLNAFTFRNWEALSVRERMVDTPLGRYFPYTTLPGPFFPSTTLAMVEVGDLGHHTPYAQPRPVVWETDAYGFRASPSPVPPELVIVGDSLVAGCGLSQPDTLASVLSTGFGIPSYALAHSDMGTFLSDERFREAPPRYLLIERVEGHVVEQFEEVLLPGPSPIRTIHSRALRHAEIAYARLHRHNLLSYLRAVVNGRPRTAVPVPYEGMLFLSGAPALEEPPAEKVSAVVNTLVRYVGLAHERGLQVAVLIVPNKETIYADVLPGAPAPRFLSHLTRELRARQVEVIDLEAPFRASRQAGSPPYLADDTHWNALGVRIAAAEIAAWVRGRATRPASP